MFDRAINGMAAAAGGLLVAVMLLTCVSVVLRYVGRPIAWNFDLTEYALLYIAFLTAPWLLKNHGHVAIDLVVGRTTGVVRRGLHVFGLMVGAVVSAVLLYYGALVTHDAYARGLDMVGVIRVPRYLVVGVIPFGSAALLIQCLRMLQHDPAVEDGGSGAFGGMPRDPGRDNGDEGYPKAAP